MSLKHIFWPITDCSSLYATGVTRNESVVLRRIDGRGYFRSRDKDGGHTIRSVMADNPILFANVTTLSFTEPELLPIEVLHGGNRKFRVFLRKIVETRNAFCGTWYQPHSHIHVHNERTVPIIMAGCIAHARNGRISTSGEKSDVTIMFPDPDFLKDAKFCKFSHK